MYIRERIVYICYNRVVRENCMKVASKRSHKHYQLDAAKIKRAQKALRTKTETETIERALDDAIEADRINRRLHAANDRFLRSGVQIKDVYGNLDN